MLSLAFDRKNRVLRVTVSGIFASDEMEELDRVVIGFIARHGQMRGIYDYTDVEAMAVPDTRLIQRAQQPAIMRDQRVIVASRVLGGEGARAYGRYQIMGKNIPVWSKEVLGREVTPEEFMRDPKIQDAIFDKKFGDYVAKHGERGAASMWFTGSPNFDADKKDALGTTVKSYATRYLEGLGAPLDVGAKYPTQSPAQSPAQSPGAPAVAGATEKPKDPYASGFADISKSIGGMLGGGTAGGSGQLPIAKAPAPMSTMMEAQPANILNPQAGEAQRQQLAMAMARLNSGKLWV